MVRITKYSGGMPVIQRDRIKDAAAALAAYEETGLTPEEIMDGKLLTGWIPVEEMDMAKFIKIPLTEEMENDYKECARMMDDGVEKACESCSLAGGNLECIGEYQWCQED